jgi:hypothetical protein
MENTAQKRIKDARSTGDILQLCYTSQTGHSLTGTKELIASVMAEIQRKKSEAG